jgi:long-subunit fatty acid transport protein
VPGIGRYYLNTMKVVRGMNDSVSLHIGGEWEVWKRRTVLRAGYLFETSATPDATMSVLTSDGLKNMVTIGAGLKVFGKVRLDIGYGHVFYLDRNVTNSQSWQVNPIQPDIKVPVGNGLYKIDSDVISVGLDARL